MSERAPLDPAKLAVDALRTRVRPHKLVRFPAPASEESFNVANVVPEGGEIQRAQIDAVKAITAPERKLDAVQLAILSPSALVEVEQDYHLLAACIRRPWALDMPMWGVEDLRRLTTDERVFLLGECNAFARERSPISTAQSAEEVSAMIAELKRVGALPAWVMCSDTDTLRSTVLALAASLPTPTSESSSAT